MIATYIVLTYISYNYEKKPMWEAKERPSEDAKKQTIRFKRNKKALYEKWTLRRVIGFFALGVVVIFAAGVVLANVADVLAVQTGLGSSFIGATLVAASTSLPELSVTVMAARLGNFDTAVSNIFGSNSGMIVTLFLADAFYREGSILEAAGNSAYTNVAMGIVVTSIYLVGLLRRRDKAILDMGYDSILVIGCYIATIVIIYQLR